ncbi:amidohydrolase family protein [Streptomyces sp. NBC_00825]|uniref:amidohydrolase family protein n=1 Tax=unclassified Streptomyces TaxID=2593676 RepID=UPI002254A23A|nr:MULTISPECIES: amidohydrolase family protein [unclassified Streptomyces]WTB51838.1 amidohydrolase family protein [Streptomyces sp. NBC_00826]WTH95269.1 amidohydrolase family protein [Streptomyces sp. NBC_00825]WTI04003.1 amidohydrolase family protein [Streptomyces sp. NBC_00822]MCX4869596.1 amidohydrolase family protein [Streptomyces sp. NBC_00906]MCX4900835.1 amidohydrolase family protein [Streptomyces sp. NBC_00892]
MTVIDAHVHLWDPDLHDHAWLQSAGELHRPFLLDDLTAASRSVTAVVVQAGRTVDEARWLLGLAARSPRIAGVVVHTDLADPAAVDTIDALRVEGGGSALVGVRDPAGAGEGARLGLPQVRRSLAALGERGLAMDLLLGHGTLREAYAAARDLPQVRFVVDHAAISAVDVRREGLSEWAAQLTPLGRLPNVVCKLSGLGKATAEPGGVRLDAVARVLLDVFGPRRLAFGSDWPVSTQWSPYEDVVGATARVLGELTADEATTVWGGTAIGAYGLDLADTAIDNGMTTRQGEH